MGSRSAKREMADNRVEETSNSNESEDSVIIVKDDLVERAVANSGSVFSAALNDSCVIIEQNSTPPMASPLTTAVIRRNRNVPRNDDVIIITGTPFANQPHEQQGQASFLSPSSSSPPASSSVVVISATKKRRRKRNESSIIDLTHDEAIQTNSSSPLPCSSLTTTTTTTLTTSITSSSSSPSPTPAKRRRGQPTKQPAECVPIAAQTPLSPSSMPPSIVIECPVCMDTAQTLKSRNIQVLATPCGHILCRICLNNLFGSKKSACCPICRKNVTRSKTITLFL